MVSSYGDKKYYGQGGGGTALCTKWQVLVRYFFYHPLLTHPLSRGLFLHHPPLCSVPKTFSYIVMKHLFLILLLYMIFLFSFYFNACNHFILSSICQAMNLLLQMPCNQNDPSHLECINLPLFLEFYICYLVTFQLKLS